MNFSIGELHPNTPHLLADLAELLLIVRYNGRTSLHKNDIESILQNGTISPEEIDAEISVEAQDVSDAEKNGRREQQLEDLLTHLDYRANALTDYYPFVLNGETLILREDITEKQRVYMFLVACSRLRSFAGVGIPQKWAKKFALLSKEALGGLLPEHANVRIFDANSEDRVNYYNTDLRIALKRLGRDLRVLGINEEECNKKGPSGDAGLDLVAIVDFDDGAATAYAVLAQCGAQETGWPKKTLEAHAMRFRNFFQMMIDYPGVMFTPVCFRVADGSWVDTQSANGIFLADRGRILKLLDHQDLWVLITGSDWFLEFETTLSTVQAPD
ncbi:hypothetical protein MTYP_01902 [Methylophilaceae bacterium]|nr:hypothetical protein MTYP_01902 [Methylophilaceae bacterium]